MKYRSSRSQASDWGIIDAICGRIGCKTGYLKVLGTGGRVKDERLAGDGEGSGSHPGDWAGGVSPMKGAEAFPAEAAKRKPFVDATFCSGWPIKENAASPYPLLNPGGGSNDDGDRWFAFDDWSI